MGSSRPSERRGDAGVAVLLTWFVPGAGHLYLGRTALALVAFLVVEALYLAGWLLSDGRAFEFLDPELRGPFATLLAPEAGNLGAMLLHRRISGFGAAEVTPFPPWIVLGSALTSISGLLNLLVAVHAHLAARAPARPDPAPARHPAVLLAAAWLFPGLGHWLQGRRFRALVVAALLLGLFALGTWLAAGSNLSRERHFYYWSGQIFLGGPALLLEALAGGTRVTGEIRWVDVGLLYGCMAGLLNVLAMLDVQGVAEERWLAASSLAATPRSEVAAGGRA